MANSKLFTSFFVYKPFLLLILLMNKYEIIGIVGEGAYGIVYKAKNKDTGEFGKCEEQRFMFILSFIL